MSGPDLHGSLPALITPFKGGKVAEEAFQAFVEWQISEGTHGLVPCGTTGESATLSHEEDMRVTALCIEAAAGRVPVVAGTGSNSTDEAIQLTHHAKQVGADAALIVAPYYNKPTQEGIYQHFKAIHDAVDIPIVVYNVPGRTVSDISVETMGRLAALANVIGVKDATADLTRPVATRLEVGANAEGFIQLSGEDATVVPFLAQGGVGCISVTANVAPRLCADLHNAWKAGDLATVSEINDRLFPLHDALFQENSPAGIKYAVSILGRCENEMRLPVVPISAANEDSIRTAMISAGLLN